MRARPVRASPLYPKIRFVFTDHPITVWAGAILLRLYFELLGLRAALGPILLPFTKRSPNQIPAEEVLLAWFYGLALGIERFEHLTRYRRDPLLSRLLGLARFPSPDTVQRLFKAFTYRHVTEVSEALMHLTLTWMRPVSLGHTLDLDSTVFCRYGTQEGSRKGYNSVKPGRPVSADGISPQNTEIERPLNTGHNVPSPLITTEEGRMLRKEDFMVIHALARRGLYVCDIAKQVGVHPRTVRRALARGGPPAPRPSRRGSRLDPYRAAIDRLLAEDVWNAVVIFREIQAQGYTGRLSILRDYIRPKRALRVRRATVRFETAPGQQLQSDWAVQRIWLAGQETTVHFIVNTLGFSRRFHFWCTDREDAEHTYEGLIRSFEWLGGVPGEVLVDNQKAAVLEHRRGGPARFHPRFVDLAGHDGFVPRACRPARAQTKGKDERMVGYIKHHFFVRYRAFDSWAHLNQLAEHWLRAEADARCQGTVQEMVAERFAREAPALRPLPAVRYDTAYREFRQVGWDAYIDVRGRRYSVPGSLAGQTVQIRLTLDGALAVYDGEQLVASHRVTPQESGWVTVPSHHATLWAQTLAVEPRPLSVYEEVTS